MATLSVGCAESNRLMRIVAETEQISSSSKFLFEFKSANF
jgi:hypothetical protein